MTALAVDSKQGLSENTNEPAATPSRGIANVAV